MTDRNDNLDRLLKHAAEAERFASWVEGAEAPARRSTPAARWWIGGSAAAAAVALGFMLLRPTPAPVGPGPVANGPRDTAPHGAAPTTREPTPTIALASMQPVDLSPWFHLAPDAEHGIPSLTDESSVLLAVYPGRDPSCGCLSWRLADGARVQQAGSEVYEKAIASPCRGNADRVTVYAVSGPRYLLPFHEEDAQRLAECLAANPAGECTTPDSALDQIATGAGGDTSLSDLAASALAMCVPSGLTVTSVATH